MRLNQYLAAGTDLSRRSADQAISGGRVFVNHKLAALGAQVEAGDTIELDGKAVVLPETYTYLMFHKPAGYVTSRVQQGNSPTIYELLPEDCFALKPVGRLDKGSSGLLLLTNDGELAQKLAHPKHEVKKIYHVVLDKPLTKADFDKIMIGVQLEDGLATVDAMAYEDVKDKTQVGLEIHSGRNRIVRRIFESLGYDVRGLDRVMYAGLTKKNVQRGKWRFLSEKEIRILKYLNSSTR